MKENDKLVGRGLQDLMEEHNVNKLLENEIIVVLNIDKIKPNPYQPRLYFDETKLKELSNSIKEHGIFQPIIVTKSDNDYIIVAGERRFRAAELAGLNKIPAVIRKYDNNQMAEISLVENLQREDLSAIEEAKAYEAILKQTNITQQELAKKISKSRSHVTNLLGLLTLPEEVQKMVIEKQISMGHARTLSKLEDSEKIVSLARDIIKDNMTVREIEAKTFGELKKRSVTRKNYNRKYRVERNVLTKYYDSTVYIKEDRVIFKVEDKEDLKVILEKLMKNAF